MERITKNLIAPCGINCGVCLGHLREKNKCHGCHDAENNLRKTRVNCKIRNCIKRNGKYCFNCSDFPCARLKHLDKRYQTKYGMSEIENLEFIRDKGINKFIKSQRQKWQSPKGLLCAHNKKYY